VRPVSFGAKGSVTLGLLLNLGILLAPASLMAGSRLAFAPDLGLFLVGASALCLADLAGLDPKSVTTPDPSRDRRVLALAWGQGLAVLAVFWTGSIQRLGSPGHALAPSALRIVGFILMLGGALLRHSAIRTLGARFITEIHVGPELVRRGVYGRIRHPSETGLLLAAMGTGPLLSSPAAVAVFVVLLLPIVILRTRIEDEALAAAFGGLHDRYVREAGRFLPTLRAR
jgi:protein-S-isoprenylcysteine O-methyltransferase Ste14